MLRFSLSHFATAFPQSAFSVLTAVSCVAFKAEIHCRLTCNLLLIIWGGGSPELHGTLALVLVSNYLKRPRI